MIKLFDKATSLSLGEITQEQFEFMVEALEEESDEDTDYYFTADTIDLLEDEGADAGLVALLRKALGDKSEMEIRWSRE
jgi:processive 1,2-diacylglycerol beta-glucosyltransferase